MNREVRDVMVCREALARLPELDLTELRQQRRSLYKCDASPHLSRELLLDRIRDEGGRLRFAERHVVCDSSRFDTLLAIPH
jgi:hypothetical protein